MGYFSIREHNTRTDEERTTQGQRNDNIKIDEERTTQGQTKKGQH